MKQKTKWRGVFNYRQTVKVLYNYAYSKEQARVKMCHRLAEKDGVHPSVVMVLFDGSKDNYKIEAEP
jgi:hypothetical protein